MITLNKKKFAADKNEFNNNPKGTFAGFYRVFKCRINLLDINKLKIGVIANNVCATASLHEGVWNYFYMTPTLIGNWPSYTDECNEVHGITDRFGLKVKY